MNTQSHARMDSRHQPGISYNESTRWLSQHQFAALPSPILMHMAQARLSGTSVMVYLLHWLDAHTRPNRRQTQTLQSDLANRQITQVLGVSTEALRRAYLQLQEAGLITRTQRRARNGGKLSSLVEFLLPTEILQLLDTATRTRHDTPSPAPVGQPHASRYTPPKTRPTPLPQAPVPHDSSHNTPASDRLQALQQQALALKKKIMTAEAQGTTLAVSEQARYFYEHVRPLYAQRDALEIAISQVERTKTPRPVPQVAPAAPSAHDISLTRQLITQRLRTTKLSDPEQTISEIQWAVGNTPSLAAKPPGQAINICCWLVRQNRWRTPIGMVVAQTMAQK